MSVVASPQNLRLLIRELQNDQHPGLPQSTHSTWDLQSQYQTELLPALKELKSGYKHTRPPAGEKFIWLVDRAKGPMPHYHFVVKCAGLNAVKNPVHKYWACDCCYKDQCPWQEETKIVVTSPYSQFEFHNDDTCPKLLAERRLMARAGPYVRNGCQPLPPITRVKNCKTCLNHVQCSSIA